MVASDATQPGHDRRWTHTGFGDLDPSASGSVTDLATTARLALLLLAIPVLPWMQAWLFGQMWRYAVPRGNPGQTVRLTWIMVIVINGLYVAATVLWLRNTDIDFYAAIGTTAIVSASISVLIGIVIARRQQLPAALGRKLALVTGLFSLVTPLGIALAPTQIGSAAEVVESVGKIEAGEQDHAHLPGVPVNRRHPQRTDSQRDTEIRLQCVWTAVCRNATQALDISRNQNAHR